jgi:hypothetical protein
VKQFTKPADATGPNDSSSVVQTTPPSSDTTSNGSTPPSGPVNPDPASDRTEKRTTPPPVTPPTNPPATQPGTNVPQLLTTWRTRLEALESETDAAAAGRVAREALRAIDPVSAGLSGIQLDDARYLQLLAHSVLENKDEICRVGLLVTQSRLLLQDQRDLAGLIRRNWECQ